MKSLFLIVICSYESARFEHSENTTILVLKTSIVKFTKTEKLVAPTSEAASFIVIMIIRKNK
ncbi:hypothetical protein BOQ23_13430 [Listeria monocytogenes]|nr:hypothetical protein [Listeria monocytogenes]